MAIAGAGLVVLAASRPAPSASETFAKFVDGYLDDFARRHPSIAAGNGIHAHDDLLDDFSAAAVRSEIAKLVEQARFLSTKIDTTSLTPDERVDRRILLGIIDGWLLEQQTLENWRRNPMQYAAALADGIHDLMTKESAPAPVRMRYIMAKLRAAPALLAAARTNIQNPPRLFAERGAAMMRGAADMLGKDLDLAFATETNSRLRDSLRRAADAVIPLVNAYAAYLEKDVAPRADGDFTIGAANLARRYLAEEMIDTPLDTLVAIGERELRKTQADFRAAAEKLAPGKDPQATWLSVRRNHPPMGGVVAATQSIVDSLTSFVASHGIASVPRWRTSRCRAGAAVRSRLRLDARLAAARAEAGEERFLHHRRSAGHAGAAARRMARALQLRVAVQHRGPRSDARALAAFHLHAQDAGQDSSHLDRAEPLSAALVGAGRLGALRGADGARRGIRQRRSTPASRPAQRRAHAHLSPALGNQGAHQAVDARPTPSAASRKRRTSPRPRRSAKPSAPRTTPPTAATSSASAAIIKLRADYAKRMGSRFNLREFHERFMTNGIAPIKAQRHVASARRHVVGDRMMAPRRTVRGRKVRVGVLGAGAWAEFAHLPGYKRDPRCELVAIADPVAERAKAFAEKFGIPDVVRLARAAHRTRRHRPRRRVHAERHAFRLRLGARSSAGKHVLCEKPVAYDYKDTLRAAALAQGTGCEDEARLHLSLQSGDAVHEGADRRRIRRHAVHLQRLRAELAVARSAERRCARWTIYADQSVIQVSSLEGYGAPIMDLGHLFMGSRFNEVVGTMKNFIPERVVRATGTMMRMNIDDGDIFIGELRERRDSGRSRRASSPSGTIPDSRRVSMEARAR